ncbi:MAG TPA: cytochrome c3 family protein [Bacteroidales bacterium]|nr:cytochrome c3 family protein [Bacteroidales bacterium]
MVFKDLFFCLFLSFALVSPAGAAPQQDETGVEKKQKGAEFSLYANENNENCLKCHGRLVYTITDTVSGLTRKDLMAEHTFISPDAFYKSVHWSFNCLDCHGEGFKSFPHPLEVRFETGWSCLDCHGYDPAYAQYKFEEIDIEYQKSIHYTATDGAFTCWQCHDAHYYNPLARGTGDGRENILRSNEMCLHCHGNPEVMGLVTEKELTMVLPRHEWLPNVDRHLAAVRCIDCHTRMTDNVLVAHEVMPADSAVNTCADCHSQNTILMGTLYKYASKESRDQKGFVNGVIFRNDSYVIGANRSKFISMAGLLIIAAVLAFALVHTIFRIIIRPIKKYYE